MLKTFNEKYGEIQDKEDEYDYKLELIGEYFGKRKRMIKLEEEFFEVIDAYLRKTDDDLVEELVDIKVVADSLIIMLKQNERGKKIYKHKIDRTIGQIKAGIL